MRTRESTGKSPDWNDILVEAKLPDTPLIRYTIAQLARADGLTSDLSAAAVKYAGVRSQIEALKTFAEAQQDPSAKAQARLKLYQARAALRPKPDPITQERAPAENELEDYEYFFGSYLRDQSQTFAERILADFRVWSALDQALLNKTDTAVANMRVISDGKTVEIHEGGNLALTLSGLDLFVRGVDKGGIERFTYTRMPPTLAHLGAQTVSFLGPGVSSATMGLLARAAGTLQGKDNAAEVKARTDQFEARQRDRAIEFFVANGLIDALLGLAKKAEKAVQTAGDQDYTVKIVRAGKPSAVMKIDDHASGAKFTISVEALLKGSLDCEFVYEKEREKVVIDSSGKLATDSSLRTLTSIAFMAGYLPEAAEDK